MIATPIAEGLTVEDKSIPLAEESLDVTRRQHKTGTTRVTVTPHHEVRPVEIPLTAQSVTVERVPVDRLVDGPVPERWEGDTLVISVVEEVPVVEKRLRLTEEIRLTRKSETRTFQADVPVRVEHADITREP